MGEMQDMGNDFMDFVESYSFKDKKEVYTNGIELVPLFRVKQAYDYYISKLEKLERALDKAVEDIECYDCSCWDDSTNERCKKCLKERYMKDEED